MKLRLLLQPVARGIALFLGAFAGLNLIGELAVGRFDANLWWIDLRGLPAVVAIAWLGGTAAAMAAYALWPRMTSGRRWATVLLTGSLAIVAVANAATVWSLAGRGAIETGFALPFSLMVAAALGVVTLGTMRTADAHESWRTRAAIGVVAMVCAGAFPLGQIFCFGMTDYRRGADAAVVFGCLAYADGRPSLPLADRVRTAVGLYEQGLVGTLIFSGGPGAGDVHETEAMRRYAAQLGVPDDAIVLDPDGLSTQHTVNNTAPLMRGRRLIAVSNFYHLPRVKLAYQRAGVDVFTVPAKDSRTMTQLPYNIAREIAALWVYYLQPLTG